MADKNSSGYRAWIDRYRLPQRYCILSWVKRATQDAKIAGRGLIVLIITGYLYYSAGTIEGWWDPVTSKATNITIKHDNWTTSRVSGNYTKLRDCEFIDLTWYSKKLKSFVPAKFPGLYSRRKGEHVFKDLFVEMPHDRLLESSVVHAYHRCHPFWVTVTDVFP